MMFDTVVTEVRVGGGAIWVSAEGFHLTDAKHQQGQLKLSETLEWQRIEEGARGEYQRRDGNFSPAR